MVGHVGFLPGADRIAHATGLSRVVGPDVPEHDGARDTRTDTTTATERRLLNGMFTPMYEKLVTVPMNESKVLPIPGGVFLHMVLQHWFMSIAVLTLALMPSRFSALIANTRPASLQCAVVRC